MKKRVAALITAVAVSAAAGGALAVTGGLPVPRGAIDDACAPPPPVESGPASLAAPREVVVAPGSSAIVPVHLDLPARPTPADVFFVFDASGSMRDALESLKLTMGAAATDLAANGIQVWVGAADFADRDYRPYHLDVQLQAHGCDVLLGLATVIADGGQEPHLVALEQAVAGNGRSNVPGGGGAVPPGLNARFRPGVTRVVVHATDEPVLGDVPESPTEGEVGAIFRQADVAHMGLNVVSGFAVGLGSVATTRASLDRVGRAAGTVAPPEGLDCEGDGRVDVGPGQPLTCDWIPATSAHVPVGRIVAQAVKALADDTTIRLETTGAGAVAEIIDAERSVALARRNATDWQVRVTCGQDGSTLPLELGVRVGHLIVARSATTVRCGALPAPPAAAGDPPATPARPPTAAGAPAAAPAPAPAPASAPAGAGAPAPANAPSPVQSPAVGGAQAPAPAASPGALALAPESAEAELALARVDDDSAAGPSPVVGGAALATLTAALAARQRRRPRSAPRGR